MRHLHFTKLISKLTFSTLLLTAVATQANAESPPETVRHIFDEPTLNGHPGYAVAADITGVLDKAILVVSGFDTDNNNRPEDELDDLGGNLQEKFNALSADGWDIMYFEYVDGGIDIKDNADNLAHFIQSLDTLAEPDYHLALIGGSMGGIVVRTMFVQEYSNMGVDTYVSVDAPHLGVTFSNWVNASIAGTLAFYMLQHPAGLQMYKGHPAYYSHYGWLENIESNAGFMENIIDPMATCAIALSDGESSWKVKNSDLMTHNKWYPISSTVEAEGLRSTYMPYHSVVKMDNLSTSVRLSFSNWQYSWKYQYRNTHSSYFDIKIPNPRDKHSGPDYAVLQAIDFVTDSY